jgi:NTE family protein
VSERRPHFFDGLSPNELAAVLAPLERRHFPAGSVVIGEGDSPREMYVAQSGSAEVYVADRVGGEHLVGRVEPGGTVGEMSLFTGQPAVATVRATSELDVVVLHEQDFELLAEHFPMLYRNVGVILSDRLARTNRLAVRQRAGRLFVLADTGAPPLLGFALASSIAWHTRAATILVAIDDDPPDDLRRLADARPPREGPARGGERGAELLLASESGDYAPDRIRETVAALFARYEYVLIQHRGPEPLPLATAQTIRIAGPDGTATAGDELAVHGWVRVADGSWPRHDRVVRVPALAPAEETALGEGWLPASAPAGRALGRPARELTGLRVGLALGAGSIRGYAHLGILRGLEREGVPLDCLAGASVGAVVAGLRAAGNDPETSADMLDVLSTTMFRPTLPRHGLMSPRAMRKLVHSRIGHHRIEELPIPLAVVTADILTQEEVVLRRGNLATALLAATAIPGVYPAMRVGRHTLVDGGVLNPVPTGIAAQSGAGAVVGVKLMTGSTTIVEGEAVDTSGPLPSALGVILRSIDLMQTRIAVDTVSVPTVTIAPEFAELPGAKLRNFSAGRRYIEAGEEAAEAAIPRLAAMLPWLRR